MRKILIPIEDKQFAEAQIDSLNQHEFASDSQFTLLSIITEVVAADYGFAVPYAYLETFALESEKHRRAMLDEVAKLLQIRFPQATIETRLEFGNATHEIIRLAKTENFDLIVMGSHGRKGFDRFILGSVSANVANHAPCSVSIVRLAVHEKQSVKPAEACATKV